MKIALCTTTINVPHVLKLYRASAPGNLSSVKFFVVGDAKTPHADVNALCKSVEIDSALPRYTGDKAGWSGGYEQYQLRTAVSKYYNIADQMHWKCSDPIGWNCIQRRNIAFLEALKWGAEIVVSVDDDNQPLDNNYFQHHQDAINQRFNGLSAGDSFWFDVGQHLVPPARQRGFPQERYPSVRYAPVTDMKVGVNAGICLGDPDVSAVDRMSQSPFAYGVTEFLRAGLVVRPHTWAPFNSQNTAILRQFVPAWGMVPFVGRFDDIFASLVAQRVMWEYGYVVRFGQPMIFQERNAHDLVKDLRAEIDGYAHVTKWTNVLDHIPLKGKSVIEDVRTVWQTLGNAHFVPKETVAAMLAYVSDCETVL